MAKMKAVSELISIRGLWKLAFPSLRLTCSSIGDTWGGRGGGGGKRGKKNPPSFNGPLWNCSHFSPRLKRQTLTGRLGPAEGTLGGNIKCASRSKAAYLHDGEN